MGGADAASTPSSSPTLSSFHDHLPHIQALAPVSLCLMALLSGLFARLTRSAWDQPSTRELVYKDPNFLDPHLGQ